MPSRFTSSGTAGKLTMKAKSGSELGELLATGTIKIASAIQHLTKTIAKLDGTSSHAVLSKYFYVGDSPSAEDIRTIKANFVLILNGLSSDVTLKSGADVGKGNTATNGVVTGSLSKTDTNPLGKQNTKAYHNTIISKDPTWAFAMNKEVRKGAIRIDSGVLQSASAVQTLIHEASHKYAGTWDYQYWTQFDHGGSVWLGGTGMQFQHVTSKDYALGNADSYAWAAWHLGKA